MAIFVTLDKETISFQYIDITFNNEVLLRMVVPYNMYEKIDKGELFNFYHAVRNQSAITFEPNKKVELRLALRSNFIPLLQDINVETLKEAFLRENKDLSFLYQAENWLLYSAVQIQDLPEGLKGSGVLKLGLQTKYEHTTTDYQQEKSPLKIVKNLFFQQNHPFEEIDEHTLRIKIKKQENAWDVLVYHDTERDITIVYSIYPELINEASRSKAAIFLMNTNFYLGIGSFEMDMNDGEVRFRTSIPNRGHPLDTTTFEKLLIVNIQTMGEFIDRGWR